MSSSRTAPRDRARSAIAALVLLTALVVSTPLAATAATNELYAVPPSGTWTVNGAGFGHGIGLSQWGTQGAALQGLRPDQIVSFYYPGTALQNVGNPLIRVQLLAFAGGAIVFGAYGAEQLYATDRATGTVHALPAADRYLLTLDASYLYVSVLQNGGWTPFQAFIGPVDINGASGSWLYSTDMSGAGRQYWGTLRLVRTGASTAQAVNELALDAYLKFVVPRESPAWWESNALQSQAIAARSYARAVSNPNGAWDICDTTQCQVYGGRAVAAPGGAVTWLEAASTSTAVEATAGLILVDGNGAAAFTQYSSSNGGYSVAGSRPYLVAKADPYSGLAPGDTASRWQSQLSAATLRQRCPSGGTLNSFEITGRDGRGPFGGRITSLRVNCSNGSVTVTGATSLSFGMRSHMWQPSLTPFGNLEALETSTGGIHVKGWAISPESSTALISVVTGPGGIVSFDADDPRPDVGAVYPNFGANHGFDMVVPSGAGAMPVCVYASVGVARVTLGCGTVNVPAGVPFGHLDTAKGVPGNAYEPPGAVVTGWAIDPDTTGPIAVHLYRSGSATPTVVTASNVRPDVGNVYPAWGPAHGFAARIPAPGGTSGEACAYAINAPGPAGNPVLGCLHYSVPGGSPFGNPESMVANGGGVSVKGWAIDPDTSQPSTVRFTVDGKATYVVSASQSRPDVAGMFPEYGEAHGYSVLLPTGSGSHTVCVTFVDIGAGSDVAMGCGTMTVPPGAPFGTLDAVTVGSGSITTAGWVIDPDTPAPIQVLALIDGVQHTWTADGARPDVAAVYPSFGPNHGFSQTVPVAPGNHWICVYAVNVPGPAPNPWLGCVTVSVP